MARTTKQSFPSYSGGMDDADTADSDTRGKHGRKPWVMVSIPLALTLALNFASTFLAAQMPPVENGVQHYRPPGGLNYLSSTHPAIWACAIVSACFLVAARNYLRSRHDSLSQLRLDVAGRYAYRAGIVLLFSLFLSVVRAILMGFWPEILGSTWIEYGLIAMVSLLMLWRPMGTGTTGFREAGIRFNAGVWPCIGLAVVGVMGVGPILRRLSHAGMPRIMAFPRAFQWSWDLAPMSFDRFVDAAILFGVLYPALRTVISKRFVPEILVAFALCADTPYHRWPLFIWVGLICAYCTKRSGSMVPAFVALLCSLFLTPWIELLGGGK